MTRPIRWGILGTGWIANAFASALVQVPGAELLAVGSRTARSAERFGDHFGIQRRYANSEALVQDPEVDVVYIATPNPLHREHALLCLDSGKAVLCEKPFALNARQAEEVIRTARRRELFLMEAMWSRFFPLMARVRALVADGTIGPVQMLVADLCLRFEFDPADRRYAPDLGGGALLDLGIYTLSLASMIMGPPSKITSLAHLGPSGVDEQAGIVLGYDGGQMSVLHCSLRVDSPVEATLLGTKGRIRLHPWWIRPDRLTLSVSGREDTPIEMPFGGNGYQFEALEVMECLRNGKQESDLMPLDETLSIVRTMDAIRDQWGLTYPGE